MDENRNTLASVTVCVAVALKKVKVELTPEEYLSMMEFDLKTTPNKCICHFEA